MTNVKGVGVGGLANCGEDYTTSRYNYYAPYTFEEERTDNITFEYFPTIERDDYNSMMPIQFNIPAETEWFTQLKSLKLHGGYSIRNATLDADPVAGEVWSLINNPVHSMFSHVVVKIGGHEIADR